MRPLSATLQISLPRFISQEWIFRGFPWPTKVTRCDREGVSRVICYISAMLGFRVDDPSPRGKRARASAFPRINSNKKSSQGLSPLSQTLDR